MPAISVIMPVYNSERYVARAIGSVLAQSFEDFELIVIDDGSTDGSSSICDEFGQADERVHVYHIENEGMCHARNYAMRIAAGEYIAFCDNDDVYLDGLLENTYKVAKEYDADCVYFKRRFRRIDAKGRVLNENEAGPDKQGFYAGEALLEAYEQWFRTDGVWTRIYRRELIADHGIEFDESFRFGAEDLLFNLSVLEHARRMVLLPDAYYLWQQRDAHSSSLKNDAEKISTWAYALEKEHAFFVSHGIDKSNPALFGGKQLGLFTLLISAAPANGDARFSTEKELYEQIREMYEPYARSILSCPLALDLRLPFTCLWRRWYRLLYIAMVGVMRAKRLRSARKSATW